MAQQIEEEEEKEEEKEEGEEGEKAAENGLMSSSWLAVCVCMCARLTERY